MMPYPLAAAKSRILFPFVPKLLSDENNPYTGAPATPRLVQLHCHTNQSDGGYTPAQVVAYYAGAGYTALAISDHDMFTAQPAGITVALSANEYSPVTGHIGGVGGSSYARGGETDPQTIINGIVADGGIAILNHPNWSNGTIEGHTYAEMAALTGYLGIEIHNAVTVVQDNYGGYAVALWDQVLTGVRRNIWGFAGDDFHGFSPNVRGYDIGRVVVFSDATLNGIMAALSAGNFVADVSNYGVTLNPPTVVGNTITLSCPGATAIRFVGTGGALLSSTPGETGEYTVIGNEDYVRAEVVGSYTEGFGAAIDQFNRWSADSGTWTVSGGVISVSNEAQTQWLSLKRHILGDIEITCDLMYIGGDNQAGIIFNSNAAGTGYYLRVRHNPDENDLTLYKLPSTLLDTAEDASIINDEWFSTRIRYTADTGLIQARVWKRGNAEPATWALEATDTSLKNGFIALRSRAAASFDNLYINGFKSYYQPIGVTAP